MDAEALSRVRLECGSHLCEEFELFVVTGDPHTLERSVEFDVNVEIASILMEVQERMRAPRKVAALALSQLWEFA